MSVTTWPVITIYHTSTTYTCLNSDQVYFGNGMRITFVLYLCHSEMGFEIESVGGNFCHQMTPLWMWAILNREQHLFCSSDCTAIGLTTWGRYSAVSVWCFVRDWKKSKQLLKLETENLSACELDVIIWNMCNPAVVPTPTQNSNALNFALKGTDQPNVNGVHFN